MCVCVCVYIYICIYIYPVPRPPLFPRPVWPPRALGQAELLLSLEASLSLWPHMWNTRCAPLCTSRVWVWCGYVCM